MGSLQRNREAATQAVRTAAVAFGGFAIGYWGLRRLDVAVFATFGGLALVGIADFRGSLAGRFGAHLGAAAAGGTLAVLGTWASAGAPWTGAVITFLAGSAAVFAGLLGGYVAVGTNAVLLYYLVALGTPAHLNAVPGRLAGVALGGGLAAAASVLIWPQRDGPGPAAEIATEAERLADRLHGVVAVPPGVPARSPTAPVPAPDGPSLRARVDAATSRPDTPTARGRALLYLVNDLERLDRLIDAATVAAGGYDARQTQQLAAAGDDLARVAASLRGEHLPPLTGQPAIGADLVARIRYSSERAVAHANAALGGHSLTVTLIRHAGRRALAHARPDSVQLRNAVRTGAALAAAYVAARWTMVQHGFWVDLASLTVLTSTARATGRRAASAALGTAVGVALAVGILIVDGSDTTAYAVLTPLAIGSAIWAREALGFGAGQGGFTVAVVILFSLLRPAGWQIGLLRLEDVFLGAAVALLVSAVAWPGGARDALARDVADLRRAAAAYLTAVVEALAVETRGGSPQKPTSATLDGARRRATAAAVRTEDAFAQLLAERPGPQVASGWAMAVSAANRIWYVADLLRAQDAGLVVSTAAVSAVHRLEASRAADVPAMPSGSPDPLSAWLDDLARI